jgi:excisionase family DNA binding protein
MTKMSKQKQTDINSNSDGKQQDFYTVKQAATKLDLTERTVTENIRTGKIKAYKTAGKWFILHSDLLEFVTSKD